MSGCNSENAHEGGFLWPLLSHLLPLKIAQRDKTRPVNSWSVGAGDHGGKFFGAIFQNDTEFDEAGTVFHLGLNPLIIHHTNRMVRIEIPHLLFHRLRVHHKGEFFFDARSCEKLFQSQLWFAARSHCLISL